MKDLKNFEIIQIPVKNISVIWRNSQREYNDAWAKELAEKFDPDKFEPVTVTKPNGAGIYHAIEGQHRTRAVEKLWGPNECVPCHVVAEADPARAAEIWLGINGGRKGIKPIREFLVAVEARRTLECNINIIIKRAGYHVDQNTKADNAISAVGALRKIYNKYGETLLFVTLSTSRKLWGNDPSGVQGAILMGMSLFLNEFSRYMETSHLVKTIQQNYKSPRNFIDAARFASERSNEPLDVAMSDLVRMKYNKGRHESKKLKRKES